MTAKAGKLRVNAKTLEDKILHLCVRDTPELEPLVNHFNAGLEQIDSETIVKAYFQNAFN